MFWTETVQWLNYGTFWLKTETKPGGFHIIGVFTNRLPATPDNAPFTKSLFDVGELPAKYAGWEILAHSENTLRDSHPGGVSHEHAYERIIAERSCCDEH
jgi:tellurite methyltransferase